MSAEKLAENWKGMKIEKESIELNGTCVTGISMGSKIRVTYDPGYESLLEEAIKIFKEIE